MMRTGFIMVLVLVQTVFSSAQSDNGQAETNTFTLTVTYNENALFIIVDSENGEPISLENLYIEAIIDAQTGNVKGRGLADLFPHFVMNRIDDGYCFATYDEEEGPGILPDACSSVAREVEPANKSDIFWRVPDENRGYPLRIYRPRIDEIGPNDNRCRSNLSECKITFEVIDTRIQIPSDLEEEGAETSATEATAYVDLFYVTLDQYLTFIERRGYENRSYWTDAGWSWLETLDGYPDSFPLERKSMIEELQTDAIDIGINRSPAPAGSWYEANAYCAAQEKRLLTLDEFETFVLGADPAQNFIPTPPGENYIQEWLADAAGEEQRLVIRYRVDRDDRFSYVSPGNVVDSAFAISANFDGFGQTYFRCIETGDNQ